MKLKARVNTDSIKSILTGHTIYIAVMTAKRVKWEMAYSKLIPSSNNIVSKDEVAGCII